MEQPNLDELFEMPAVFYNKWTWIFALSVGMFFSVRSYFRGPQYLRKVMLKGKVTMVTGATSGIGRVVALDFAHRGAKVYLCCRDPEKGREAAEYMSKDSRNPHVHCLDLDLRSMASVRACAAEFKKREEKLDILINNAGVMCGPKEVTPDGFDAQFSTNYLGHYLLTRLLLPAVQSAGNESTPSRILCMSCPAYKLSSSIPLTEESSDSDRKQPKEKESVRKRKNKGGSAGDTADGGDTADDAGGDEPDQSGSAVSDSAAEAAASSGYAQSKLAVMLFMRRLARDLESDPKVIVNACHPGVCNTALHQHMGFKQPGFLKTSMTPLVWFFMKSEVDGAQTPIFLSVDGTLKGVSGKYYADMQPEKVTGLAADDDSADLLWNKSAEWVGLSPEL